MLKNLTLLKSGEPGIQVADEFSSLRLHKT